ncbi:hypothetical protein AOR10_24385, partial [Vibrio alginolyticus]
IGLHIGVGAAQRVVLQGQGRRQVLGGSEVGAIQLDVMIEGLGGQQLDAQLVGEAIAQGKGEGTIVLNVDISSIVEIAVIALGLDLGHADAGKEVAGAVSEGLGAGGDGSGGDARRDQGGEGTLAHGIGSCWLGCGTTPRGKISSV